MKRLYVVPSTVYHGQATSLANTPLTSTTVLPTKAKPSGTSIPVTWAHLFHPQTGSHFLQLSANWLLINTDVEYSEYTQELWHSCPHVARLPHPVYEPAVTLVQITTDPLHAPKKFNATHLAALVAFAPLGCVSTDTALTLAAKAKALHPGMGTGTVL